LIDLYYSLPAPLLLLLGNNPRINECEDNNAAPPRSGRREHATVPAIERADSNTQRSSAGALAPSVHLA
jgi:hypothetical protein